MNKYIYLLALQCTLWKPTLFLKCKPCDIRINSFSIHVGPLWEANIDAQYILDPYATTTYYISYLTKVDKFVIKRNVIDSRKMQTWTNKHKHLKKLGTTFLNA
jgi:hypothetical protein